MKPKSKIASFFNALFVNFRHINFLSKIERVVEKMKPSEKILFYTVSAIFAVSSLVLLIRVHNSFLVEVPSFGGSFIEGLIGSPRFVNPILAISDTDKDLSSLIYSGLLKYSVEGGFEKDLAGSYDISEDGKTYDFVIRDDAFFHDGKAVTADDIKFTIEKVLDPVIKSPKRASWDGILVEKVSDKEIKFTLNKPYSPFLNALTMGILPKHMWENATSEEFPFSEFNLSPVGSGHYKVEKISRNSGGIPTSITLSSFKEYVSGRPLIKSIIFKFFQNETDVLKAYDTGSIESIANLDPVAASHIADRDIIQTPLPRVFGIFFNQNVAPVFLNKEVREALDIAAPKSRIINETLNGFGRVLNGPTPGSMEDDPLKAAGNIEEARDLLQQAGWKENENGILEKKTKTDTVKLSFSITTSNTPELKRIAEILQETWKSLGAEVDLKIFEASDLSQNIIKGRKYDALLFGEVITDDNDLYPFWHSSERNDPGLNISLYANITTDKLLEEIRADNDSPGKAEKKALLFAEIKKDTPAIFLFSPYLLYLPPPKVKNIKLKDVSSQNERFLSISKWYIETDKVWKIFTR